MDRRSIVLPTLVVLALCCMRLVHLEADTPQSLHLDSTGVYVDEGYKTLDARNLASYGTTRWNPHDDFAGWWLKDAFLPEMMFYLAFRSLGEHLGSARIATVLWFAVFLFGYLWATWRDYSARLLCFGLLMLGIGHMVFFFSRTALLVQPLVTCIYCLLFLLRHPPKRLPVIALLLSGFLLLTALLVKGSAVLYFPPILIGTAVAWIVGSRPSKGQILVAGGVIAAACTLVAVLTYDLWRLLVLRLALPTDLRETLFYPLTDSSALLVAAGLLCAGHWLASRPGEFWASIYRCTLVSLVVLGPAVLWILPYGPTRYYAPLLPAFVLVVLEWLHLRSWESPFRRQTPVWVAAVGVGVCLWAMLCLGRAVSKYGLSHLEAWQWLGGSGRILFPYAEIALGLSMLVIWRFRRRVLTGKVFLAVVVTVLLFGIGRDLYLVGGFLARPSYRSREIAAAIDGVVPDGESIAGDWAPFFALGTGTRALRMSGGFNYPRRVPIEALRPDYYLFSDSGPGRHIMELLEADEAVVLEPPVLETTYLGRRVALYPLRYAGE